MVFLFVLFFYFVFAMGLILMGWLAYKFLEKWADGIERKQIQRNIERINERKRSCF